MRAPFLLAHVSDCHVVEGGAKLGGQVDTNAHLERAIAFLSAFEPRPDLLLLTGDLVDSGRPAQYAQLRELLAPLPIPFLALPGNHDDASLVRELQPELRWAGDRCDAAIDGPLRLVCLDSSRLGQPGGALDHAQLAWLDGTLASQPSSPTVVALHHPPFVTGIEHMDAMALDATSAAALAEVVSSHAQVERVLCGHLHRMIVRRWAGTVAMTVPSTAHAVALDLRHDAVAGWNREPPAMVLHRFTDADGVVTHTTAIGDFPATPFGAYD